MAFKVDIGHKGKTYHLEVPGEELVGKKIGDVVQGSDVAKELHGAEFMITGASDKAGLPASTKIEGTGLRRVLLKKGFALWKKHKKKKSSNPKVIKGLRKRKALRGSTISEDISQINLRLVKEGEKPLDAILGKKDTPAAPEAA